MSGIGIILNPYSRSNRRNPGRIKQLGFIVGDKGSCHATETLDQVRELAHEFKERGVEILGISGGDGTNHKTLSTFLDVYGDQPLPKIAFLRGGTMNNMANQLNIRGTPERILSNLIIKYHQGGEFSETRICMVKVNGAYGFHFGCGLIARFLNRYQQAKGGPTPASGLALLVQASFSALINGRFAQHLCERFDCKITVDGKVQPFKNYMMVFAGTMESLGFNFRALYRANSEVGKFQTVAISSTPRQLISIIPYTLLAKPVRSENVCDEMGSVVEFEFDQPMVYTVDGDFSDAPTQKVVVESGPLLNCIVS